MATTYSSTSACNLNNCQQSIEPGKHTNSLRYTMASTCMCMCVSVCVFLCLCTVIHRFWPLADHSTIWWAQCVALLALPFRLCNRFVAATSRRPSMSLSQCYSYVPERAISKALWQCGINLMLHGSYSFMSDVSICQAARLAVWIVAVIIVVAAADDDDAVDVEYWCCFDEKKKYLPHLQQTTHMQMYIHSICTSVATIRAF